MMSSRVIDSNIEVGNSLSIFDQFMATTKLTARGVDVQCL